MDASSSILGLNSLNNAVPNPSINSDSIYNLETVYKNNTKFATQSVLPIDNYNSPYYIPFKNIDDPRPVDQLIYRFSIWKMIIKQIIFYYKEMCVFKSQTYQGNKAMLENLEILKRQNSGKLKIKANANKIMKKSLNDSNDQLNNINNINNTNNNVNSSGNSIKPSLNRVESDDNINYDQQNLVNKLLQTTFLPPGDMSILSISSTFFNNHNYLKEKELLTYQQLTNKLIPRLENLKDQLNEVIKQMSSIKNSSDYKTKNLKMEIAKTGGILSDYITSIELLRTGHSKSSLGTTIDLKDNKIDPKLDPYILKLKLDLQLKDQLYIEAHLKEMYYDLQYKSVQLEKILYSEIQSCISNYTDLIDSELNTIKNNLIQPLKEGFLKNDPTIDWDYFIKNDRKKNFLAINAKDTLDKIKKVRTNSDIFYPYRNNVISSCIYSGYLERKSKYLKNYSKFYYVLTINFLHEFKSNDRIKDLHPLQSFPISDLKVSIVENDERKFIIRIYKKNENDKLKFTFKSQDTESINKWIDYLSDLTEFKSTIERNISYDASDDEMDDYENYVQTFEQNSFENQNKSSIPLSPQLSSFNDLSINDSLNKLVHSRSSSDEFLKAQLLYQQQQQQQHLQQQQQQQQQQQNKIQDNDYFNNVGTISFKSIKNARQSSSSSLPLSNSNSRSSSRNSSRSSSRASSPNRGRTTGNTVRNTLLSPKLTPTGNPATSSGDYFSYAPRKVQASIIRNGNRLASVNNNVRLTPGSIGNLSNQNIVNMNKSISSSSLQDLNKSITLNVNNITPPLINITESSPVNGNKPNLESFGSNDNNNINPSAGLSRRRKTLSEKLDITGLASANKLSHLINSQNNTPELSNVSSNLPQTPGVIPGSMMNQIFDSQTPPIHEEESHQ